MPRSNTSFQSPARHLFSTVLKAKRNSIFVPDYHQEQKRRVAVPEKKPMTKRTMGMTPFSCGKRANNLRIEHCKNCVHSSTVWVIYRSTHPWWRITHQFCTHFSTAFHRIVHTKFVHFHPCSVTYYPHFPQHLLLLSRI